MIVAYDPEELSTRAAEFNSQFGMEVVTIAKDLAKRESPFEVYDFVKAQGIQIDALVNNAG